MKKFFLQSLLVCIFLIPIAYSQEISEEFLKTLPPGVRSDVLNRIDDQEKITDPTYSSLQTQTKIEKKELEDETAEDDDFIRNIDDLMVFGSDFFKKHGVEVVSSLPHFSSSRTNSQRGNSVFEKSIKSELSGNVIDLCPVGALTSKPYVFEARPWELKKTETIDVMDAVGSNIRVDTYDWEVKRVLPVINEDINEEWISDKTRYACDGLLNQRLDTPYIKYNNKFEKASWDEVYKIIKSKIENTDKEKICGFVGDLINMEASFIFKEFFERTLGSKKYDSRSNKNFVDSSSRENYLFNSTINGVEDSDLILLIGTNPRFEATMLNARIRKAYLNNNTKIISLNEIGDLTYPYVSLDGKTQTLHDIIENKNDISNEIIKSKKPIIIFGESFLNLKSAEYLFFALKDFLLKNDKFKENWNPLNLLSSNAATVGSLDLDIVDETNSLFEELNNNKFKLIYLLGRDDLNFKKKDEFIIYQGSHGDKGAEIADIILPGSAYTEQSGHFTNLEGKIQKAYKASYPPGEAKEDWQIINELSSAIKGNALFNNKEELLKSMHDYLNTKNNINFAVPAYNFKDEKILVEDIDYYYSNTIARASKTMSECRYARANMEKTGTEG